MGNLNISSALQTALGKGVSLLSGLVPGKVKGLLDDSTLIEQAFGGVILSKNSPHAFYEVHIDDIVGKTVDVKNDFSVLDGLSSGGRNGVDQTSFPFETFQKGGKLTEISLKTDESTVTNGRGDTRPVYKKAVSFKYISPEGAEYPCTVESDKFSRIFRMCFQLSKYLSVDFNPKKTS